MVSHCYREYSSANVRGRIGDRKIEYTSIIQYVSRKQRVDELE